MRPHLLALMLLALAATFVPAQAQERPAGGSAALEALTVEARSRVVREAPAAVRTRTDEKGRVEVEGGLRRAAYRVQARVAAGTPEQAARAYLRLAAAEFGWPDDSGDLAVAHVRTLARSSHVVFQQMLAGIPVHGRQVSVSLDAALQPTMALSTYAAHIGAAPTFSPTPGLSAEAARERAAGVVAEGAVETGDAALVVLPEAEPRPAWRVIVWTEASGGEWEVLLDAHTGEVIQLQDQTVHAHPSHAVGEEEVAEAEGQGAALSRPLVFQPARSVEVGTGSTAVSGTGLVFMPDPLTSARSPYGGAYSDANDADVAELNDELRLVTLPDLTLRDGWYYLEGPYVRIVGTNHLGTTTYTPPRSQSAAGFQFTRAHDGFEAVMAYYHVDASRRYVEALGLGLPIPSVDVNPQAYTHDNSQFYGTRGLILFGTGGIDDAEDAQVIVHEYGHAILHASASNLLSRPIGQSFHEGWADYWAASFKRRLFPEADWRRLFDWDGNNGTWCGRWLDHPGRYPDWGYEARGDCFLPSSPTNYQLGLLWATTLMEVYSALGPEVTDRINLASHAGLIATENLFQDAAEALLQADRDLYGGAHVGQIGAILYARGFLAGPVPVEMPDEPAGLALHPNYPDPFSETTTLRYTMDRPGRVVLDVYDVLGRRVLALEDAVRQPGTYTVAVDASGLPGGLYVARLTSGAARRTETLVVAR